MKCNSDKSALQKNWNVVIETLRDNLALTLLVLHDEYGFGRDRIVNILEKMAEYAKQFDEWQADGVLDYKREQLTGRFIAEKSLHEFLKVRLKGIIPDEFYDELLCNSAPSNHDMRAKFKRNTAKSEVSLAQAMDIQKKVAAMRAFLGGAENGT